MPRLQLATVYRVLAVLVAWLLPIAAALRDFIPCHIFVPRRTPTLSQPKQPPLPPEIIDAIIQYYLELTILRPQNSIRDYRLRNKCLLEVGRLKLCSRDFSTRVDNRISKIWPHWGRRGPCSKLLEFGSAATVQYGPDTRIIIADVCSSCLPRGANLTLYPKLESVSLNCHNALTYDQLSNRFSLLPFNRVVALPRFLTQLEVLHSHRPVGEIINLVTSACPGLTELRIVRCTMFNNPGCWWWRQHCQDADHDYMRNHNPHNMTEYANSLAGSLYGLKKLEAFHIGHYMTHINAVMTHRTQHKKHHPSGLRDSLSHVDGIDFHNEIHLLAMRLQDGGPPIDFNSPALAKRELWEVPCPQCEKQFRTSIEATEHWVASILASKLESIRTISFPSFLSDKRIHPSHWNIQREIKSAPGKKWAVVEKVQAAYRYPVGAKLRVKAKPSENRRFSGPHEIVFNSAHGDWWPVSQ